MSKRKLMTWKDNPYCSCSWCLPRGGRNRHVWAFFYFLRRCGDRPRVIRQDARAIVIESWTPEGG